MKKVILLVASLLSAIQIFASKSKLLTVDNALTLSPSHEIYNHGSHASHRSHTSHYSASVSNSSSNISQQHYTTSIIKESMASLPAEEIDKINKGIAYEWKANMKDISLKEACYAYVSMIKTTDSTSKIVAKRSIPQELNVSILNLITEIGILFLFPKIITLLLEEPLLLLLR